MLRESVCSPSSTAGEFRPHITGLLRTAVAMFLFIFVAIAQTNTSVVEGRVSDPSGAVIDACTVILTSLKTGGELTTHTNDSGTFVFPAVPVGSYSLKVTKENFRPYALDDFRVTIGQRLTQDVRLQLGPMAEAVTVEASDSAPLLEPRSNDLGTLIEPVNVQQLPLNGRNYLQLGYLSGAAQDGGPASSDFLATQTGHANRDITIAGVEQDLIGFTLNGISVASSRLGDLSLDVSIAAVDQFKVMQGFIMPAMGPDPGIVNVVTKSGSNSFHGEAFEFLRNNDLDARTFFEAQAHPGPFHRNQFGGALGGPILRKRFFFFANYEGFRQVQATPLGGFAPTQAMFTGDFSALPTNIYDPASFSAGTGQRQVFPGNTIPSGRINPVAQKLLAYYLPGSSYTTRPLNVFAEPVQTQASDQGGIRVDANLSSKTTLFGQYIHEVAPVDNPALFPVSGLYYHMNTEFAVAQLTYMWSPTVVNELHVGFTRPFLFYGGIGKPGVETEVGITGTADPNGVPGITLSGFNSFGTAQSVIGNIDNNYQLYDSLKILRGKHEIEVGGSLHYVRTVQESANWNARGTLVFNNVFTAQLATAANGLPAPVAGTGSSFADFLMGMPVSGTVTSMPRTHYRWTEFNPYVQDTWRVLPGVTVNFGLSWYVGTAPNPSGSDKRYPHAFDFQTGKVVYAALDQISPQIYSTDWKNFSPRLGVAWQPQSWTGMVIRAGAGLYHPSERTLYELFGITAPGVSIVQSIANSPSNPLPTYSLGQNAFPPMSQATITPQFADKLTGTIFGLDQGLRTPYSQQWNFSLQHSFGGHAMAEVAYVGSQSRRLPVRWNVDDCSVPGSLVCNPANQRWPQYSYVYFAADAAFAGYHALTAKVQREFSGGFNFLANYTWSKVLTNTMEGGANTPLNQMGSCLACDKGLAGFNVPQRLVIASVWQVPVGRGKHFLKNLPRAWDRVAGGWAADAIVTLSAGNPFTVNAPNNTVDPLTNFRANRSCDGRTGLKNSDLRTNGLFWLDTACFAPPAAGYFGNSGTFILSGPGANNWDLALEKTTQLREAMKVQFRAELFNAWNHAQFLNPDSTVGDANFGQVTQVRAPRQIQFGLKLLW